MYADVSRQDIIQLCLFLYIAWNSRASTQEVFPVQYTRHYSRRMLNATYLYLHLTKNDQVELIIDNTPKPVQIYATAKDVETINLTGNQKAKG